MKPLRELRVIAKERVSEILANLGDEELFGSKDAGTKDDMFQVYNEILARVTQ